jgi:general secretion pathway protein G
MSKKGFTLVELMVVIAIVGLLASIVLVNVRGTKDKARDANIKSYMYQLRNAAEMIYTQTENYNAVCDESDNTLSNSGEFGILERAIKKDNGNVDLTCFEDAGGKSFAVSSPLVASTGKHWCVESAGLSIEIDNPITSAKCQ